MQPRVGSLKTHFLSKELSALSGLSQYMVSYLCRERLLKPKLVRGKRDNTERRFGKARMFSFADVLLARSIRKLLIAGVSVKQVHRSIQVLEAKLGQAPEEFTRLHVTIIGKRIYLEPPNGPPVELTHDGQLAFSYMLEVDQLRSEAGRLVAGRTESDRERVRRHSERNAPLRSKA
jgi:DNA-binding transcriptional MerR regulator